MFIFNCCKLLFGCFVVCGSIGILILLIGAVYKGEITMYESQDRFFVTTIGNIFFVGKYVAMAMLGTMLIWQSISHFLQ